jgi:predicted dinucleotide-utilizing enzyme
MKEIKMLDTKIRELRKAAEDVMVEGAEIEAVKRNTKRILASITMLELNVCDVKEIF